MSSSCDDEITTTELNEAEVQNEDSYVQILQTMENAAHVSNDTNDSETNDESVRAIEQLKVHDINSLKEAEEFKETACIGEVKGKLYH